MLNFACGNIRLTKIFSSSTTTITIKNVRRPYLTVGRRSGDAAEDSAGEDGEGGGGKAEEVFEELEGLSEDAMDFCAFWKSKYGTEYEEWKAKGTEKEKEKEKEGDEGEEGEKMEVDVMVAGP